MKNRLFMLMVLLACAFTLPAQRFEAGMLAGFNGTQVDGDTYNGYHKPGALLGLYVKTDIAPAIFGAMELKYSQKGARSRQDPKNPIPEKYIMRLGYAEMPFYFGFRTSETISLVGGISLGYLLHSMEYDENGKFPEQDLKPFNTIDLQPFVGFRFDFLEDLTFDLRLAYSVLPVRGKPDNDLWYWRQNQFNNVISMALYYRFNRQ